MKTLELEIAPQPDDTTCGPTCLHAVYRFFGDELPLEQVIGEVKTFAEGGTLGVLLALHALRRGYRATIYTYNLRLFDPSWFSLSREEFQQRLEQQGAAKPRDMRLQVATPAYIEFLERGGTLRFEDLSERLLRRLLAKGTPVMTGLSATYLYRDRRVDEATNREDDLRGEPEGHFVVLCGYDVEEHSIVVADPRSDNPISSHRRYHVAVDRLIGAILLGIVTYDANLVVLEPPGGVPAR